MKIYLESILYLYLCIETISTSINLRHFSKEVHITTESSSPITARVHILTFQEKHVQDQYFVLQLIYERMSL